MSERRLRIQLKWTRTTIPLTFQCSQKASVYNIGRVYKAILFDLDGTLLDTLQDIADATNIALGKFGFPLHGIDTANSRKIPKYYMH